MPIALHYTLLWANRNLSAMEIAFFFKKMKDSLEGNAEPNFKQN